MDGRLYYHILIDKDKPRDGIKELRYVDPRKIRKVREISKRRISAGMSSGAGTNESALTKVVNEYFIFNDKGFNMRAELIVTTEMYTMPTVEFKSEKDLLKELKMWISNLDNTPLHKIEIEIYQ